MNEEDKAAEAEEETVLSTASLEVTSIGDEEETPPSPPESSSKELEDTVVEEAPPPPPETYEVSGFAIQHEDKKMLGETIERGFTFLSGDDLRVLYFSDEKVAENVQKDYRDSSVVPVKVSVTVG